MKLNYLISLIALPMMLLGCGLADDNDKPVFGNATGRPVNCRAYVQVAINEYRAGMYSANDAMAGLERNCGANGQIWKNNR